MTCTCISSTLRSEFCPRNSAVGCSAISITSIYQIMWELFFCGENFNLFFAERSEACSTTVFYDSRSQIMRRCRTLARRLKALLPPAAAAALPRWPPAAPRRAADDPKPRPGAVSTKFGSTASDRRLERARGCVRPQPADAAAFPVETATASRAAERERGSGLGRRAKKEPTATDADDGYEASIYSVVPIE